MIKQDTIDFMRKLDVKEIHGYDANLGLKLISPAALGREVRRRRSRPRRPPSSAVATGHYTLQMNAENGANHD